VNVIGAMIRWAQHFGDTPDGRLLVEAARLAAIFKRMQHAASVADPCLHDDTRQCDPAANAYLDPFMMD
jgi:hypothetical protein